MAREEKRRYWKIIKEEILDLKAIEKWDYKKGLKKTILEEKFLGTYKEALMYCKDLEHEAIQKLSKEKLKKKNIRWVRVWTKLGDRK